MLFCRVLLVLWCSCVSWAGKPVSRSELVDDFARYNAVIRFPRFRFNEAQLQRYSEIELGKFSTALDTIRGVPAADVSFNNTVVALDRALHGLVTMQNQLELLWTLKEDTPIKKMAIAFHAAVEGALGKFRLDTELLQRISKFLNDTGLTDEERRLAQALVADFYIHPDLLQEQGRLDLVELSSLIEQLALDERIFVANSDDRKNLFFAPSELKGLSEDALRQFKRQNHQYVVDPSLWTSLDVITRTCEVEETQRKVWSAFFMGADAHNQELIEKIVRARKRISKLAGYRSWRDKQLRSAHTNAERLLADFRKFRDRAQEKFEAEKQEIAALIGHQPKIWELDYAWELKRRSLGLSEEEQKKYFEYNGVIDRLFRYTERLFGIQYREVSDAKVWKGAKVYAIYDDSSKKPLGVFTLDPFLRRGKNAWYLTQLLRTAYQNANGTLDRPFAHLHLSFVEGKKDKPTLLAYDDVWVIFHELGHTLHFLLNQQRFQSFAPDLGNTDLVEFPSTVLEELAWKPDVIRLMARHVETGELMPDDLIAKIAAQNQIFPVHALLERVAKSVLDLTLHSAKAPRASDVERGIFKDYYYELPPGGHYSGSFGYLNGYDSIYWTYPWSRAMGNRYATRFERSDRGVEDSRLGLKFRRDFLEAAALYSSRETLRRTLGKGSGFCPALLALAGLKSTE